MLTRCVTPAGVGAYSKVIRCLALVSLLFAQSLSASTPNAAELFEARVTDRLTRVREFRFITDWAKREGVRIWLAGGTASSFVHTVKRELIDEENVKSGRPTEFVKSRFKYRYFDLYRSTQDADIVIDAPEAKAEELEELLREEFDYVQGSKSVWELRLLREKRNDKEAIVDNPDYQNQNSDSQSVGLVELTDPAPGESRIRSAFDWESGEGGDFLTDALRGEIRYYRNRKHAKTLRVREGKNPEILSVIRYLSKAFQYGLSFRKSDLTDVQTIIDEFDPTLSADQYRFAENSITSNAAKLIRHSENVERSFTELKRLGLLPKLLKAISRVEVLTLLKREPLRTYPIGGAPIIELSDKTYRPTFRTAKSLKIDLVSHETKDFLAFENITFSKKGEANVLISRRGFEHEQAVHGDGYYTRIGRMGARATGLTIRFKVDPRAVEGRDFFRVNGESDYIVFRNKAAIHVLDEIQEITPEIYFKLVVSGEIGVIDRGIMQQLESLFQSEEEVHFPLYHEKNLLRKSSTLKSKADALLVLGAWVRISRRLPAWFTPDLYLKLVATGLLGENDVALMKLLERHLRAQKNSLSQLMLPEEFDAKSFRLALITLTTWGRLIARAPTEEEKSVILAPFRGLTTYNDKVRLGLVIDFIEIFSKKDPYFEEAWLESFAFNPELSPAVLARMFSDWVGVCYPTLKLNIRTWVLAMSPEERVTSVLARAYLEGLATNINKEDEVLIRERLDQDLRGVPRPLTYREENAAYGLMLRQQLPIERIYSLRREMLKALESLSEADGLAKLERAWFASVGQLDYVYLFRNPDYFPFFAQVTENYFAKIEEFLKSDRSFSRNLPFQRSLLSVVGRNVYGLALFMMSSRKNLALKPGALHFLAEHDGEEWPTYFKRAYEAGLLSEPGPSASLSRKMTARHSTQQSKSNLKMKLLAAIDLKLKKYKLGKKYAITLDPESPYRQKGCNQSLTRR